MGTESNASVFQLGSGMWAFRYTYTRNGKRVSKQVSKDENGNPLKNRRAAIKARQAAIDNAQNSRRPKPTVRKTVQEVYQEYCTNGRNDRAYTTKRKQDSLWKNHLCARFGERYIDEISAAEVVDYLTELYCSRGLSYRYVEGFLKMFYHYLRHTYGTMMAELNTPQHLLCSQMGHGNIQVTQRYYIALSKAGIDILRENLNRL